MKQTTPLRAIRAKCLDCCCGQIVEVRNCTAFKCPLNPYKMGHKPKATNYITEEDYSEKRGKKPHFLENTANDEEKIKKPL